MDKQPLLQTDSLNLLESNKPTLDQKEREVGKLVFLLLGVGTAITRNAIYTAIDFFQYEFSNYQVAFWFPIPQYISTNLFSLLIIKYSKQLSFRFQMYGTFLIMTIINVYLPIVSFILGDLSGFIVCLITNFLLGFANSINQSCCLGFSNIFYEDQYIVYFVAGTGLAGLMIGVVRMICLFSFGQGEQALINGTIVYFVVSGIFMLIIIYTTHIYRQTKYCRYYLEEQKENDEELSQIEPEQKQTFKQSMFNQLINVKKDMQNIKIYCRNMSLQHRNPSNPSFIPYMSKTFNACQDVGQQEELDDKQISPMVQVSPTMQDIQQEHKNMQNEALLNVYYNVRLNAVMVWLNFVISYSLFPGVMLLKNYSGVSKAWNTTLLVCNYNLFGTIGKISAVKQIYNRKSVSILVLLRLVFYYTFLEIVHSPSDSFMGQYYVAQINCALFAFTEGYAMSSHMKLSKQGLTSQLEQKIAGYMMNFPIFFGLLSGSLLALAFKKVTPNSD